MSANKLSTRGQRVGPRVTIKRSCLECACCESEKYVAQGDSGRDVYCTHPSMKKRRLIGDTRWDTPTWCQEMAEDRSTALERELEQLRDEVRATGNTLVDYSKTPGDSGMREAYGVAAALVARCLGTKP